MHTFTWFILIKDFRSYNCLLVVHALRLADDSVRLAVAEAAAAALDRAAVALAELAAGIAAIALAYLK